MKAAANSTQLKQQIAANNKRWEEDKNRTTIRVYSDGTVSYGNGEPMTWAEAHAHITDGRKHWQAERKDAAGKRKADRQADKRKKLAAKIEGVITGLVATGMTEEEARALLSNGQA